MLKTKKKLNSKLKVRLTAGVFGLMSMVLVGSILASVFATASDYYYDSANVSLNGVDAGTAYMYLRTAGGGTFYTMQGDFSINETNDDNGYISLSSLMAAGENGSTSIVNFESDGFRRLLHTDSNYDGNQINANNPIMIAVYSVDKDTPAGDYTVSVSNVSVVGGTSGFDGEHLPDMVGTIHVTRNDEPDPAEKPSQVVTFRDGDNNPITEITKYYGDEDFTITKEVTTGDGAIVEYHPDDGESEYPGSIVHTVPDSDLVGVGEPGDMDVCARVEETANYAETWACYTVHVQKRPINIVGATIEDKVYDGTVEAHVTGVTFEDRNLNDDEYEAEASFSNADIGEDKAVRVTVELEGEAANHYVLSSWVYNTTKTISPFQLGVGNVVLPDGNSYSHSPNGVEPEVMVTAYPVYGGTYTLTEGEDYELVYSDNTSVGTGRVSIAGKGNFTTGENPIVLEYAIGTRGINGSNLVAPNKIVEGRILSEDDIDINVDGVDLVRCDYDGQTDCDYVLSITGNTGIVGDTVNVMAEGRNNYTGVAGKDIEIVAKLEQTVTFSDVTGDIAKTYGDDVFTYTATTDGDGTISYASSDSTVATVDLNSGLVEIVGVGEVNITATATETGTYAEGSVSYHLIVSKKTITIAGVTISNKTYDGSTAATVTEATLSDDDLLVGDGFSIDDAHFTSANVGSYDDVYVRIKLDDDAYDYYQFEGNSKTAETVGSATIAAFTLGSDNSAVVLSSTSYTYNGEAKEPAATVAVDLDGDGTKEAVLSMGTDYTISYDKNVNAGTAAATITGQGNYSGSLPAVEFTISAAPVEDVTVTAPAQTYTGSALEPVPTVTGTVNGEPVTFTTDDYYVIDHGNFIDAGDHTFGVASGMNSNYYIPITNGTFTINKAESGEPENVPSSLTGEVGKTLAELGELPEGLAWVNGSTTLTAGMNDYPVTYTKNGDTANYNTVNLTVSVLGYTAEYEVIVGAGQEYMIGEDGSALFEINANYDLFEEGGSVYVDNELVESANYESWSNSTVIKFKKEFMDSLAVGEHTLAVLFNDGGVARTTFTIANPVAPGGDEEEDEDTEPGTADTGAFTGVSGGAVATSLTVVAAVMMAGVYIVRKRNS